MSDTPRTDAEAFIIKSGESRAQYQDGEYVRAAVARQLERELNAASDVTAKFIADAVDSRVMCEVLADALKQRG